MFHRSSAFAAAVALAGFLLVFFEAASFGSGARVFPRVLGVVGALAAAAVLIQSCLQVLAQRRHAGARQAGPGAVHWNDVLISYAGPPLYALLMYVAGFWIASIVSLAGLMIVLGERRPWLIAAISAGTLAAIYVMFELSFSIRMPRGLLFA